MKVHIEPNDSGIPWSQQCMTAFTCEERLKGEDDNKCEEDDNVDVAVTDNAMALMVLAWITINNAQT